MSACSSITGNISISCANPLKAGVVATFLLGNIEDIDTLTIDGTNPTLATGLTMLTGKKMFEIQGQLLSTAPKTGSVIGKYANQYEHEVQFLVFANDPATKKVINALTNADVFALITNKNTGTGGNAKYELYGAVSGLKLSAYERDPNNTENLGAHVITLKSAEYAREATVPLTLYDTDSATTEAIVDALKVVA